MIYFDWFGIWYFNRFSDIVQIRFTGSRPVWRSWNSIITFSFELNWQHVLIESWSYIFMHNLNNILLLYLPIALKWLKVEHCHQITIGAMKWTCLSVGLYRISVILPSLINEFTCTCWYFLTCCFSYQHKCIAAFCYHCEYCKRVCRI